MSEYRLALFLSRKGLSVMFQTKQGGLKPGAPVNIPYPVLFSDNPSRADLPRANRNRPSPSRYPVVDARSYCRVFVMDREREGWKCQVGPYLFGCRVIVGADLFLGLAQISKTTEYASGVYIISLHISSATQRRAPRQAIMIPRSNPVDAIWSCGFAIIDIEDNTLQ